MRALIVDDSRFVRTFLRGLLEDLGIACEEAADADAGMKLVHEGPPFDLAFVDWYMPGMSGLEMLKQIRAEGYDRIKVMMVTTEAEDTCITQALDAGADEYLMKPFDAEALSEKLAIVGIKGAA